MPTPHYLALTLTPGIGAKTARKLIAHFGSAGDVFAASVEDLTAIPRVSRTIAEQLLASPLEQYEQELLSLDDIGIGVVTLEDEMYPANLRQADGSPVLLFVRGRLAAADVHAVAVVGSREASPRGMEAAKQLAAALADRGLTVVSGLAIGIDTAAHRGAVDVGGRTLAVLGSGLRVIHPRENAELAEEIAAQGALLSELHPDAPPSGPTLMARDRIVSGLARAVIVVEAGVRSGSLDTAAKALKQGRALYAVAGSDGTDKLLREGARRVDPDSDLDSLVEEIRAHNLGGEDGGESGPANQLGLL
ncbi:MAG: DNA-protecting protein DprA [Chloroflexi bacterium]|nr:DNA-protecting protein DprA [Chloroflexota bacterium]